MVGTGKDKANGDKVIVLSMYK